MTFGSPVLEPPPALTPEVLGIEVVDGAVPPRWAAPISSDRVCADEEHFRVQHGPVALFVEGGRRVVIDAPSPLLREQFDYLVYSVAARVLLWQQRRFAMHATLVVSPEGKATAITGRSMTGKSTTTVGLLRRGWAFGCDDVLEVELREGIPWVVPFARPIHLVDSVARVLGADPQIGRPLPERAKRAYLMAGDLKPRLLSEVIRLRRASGGGCNVSAVSELEALPILALHSDDLGVCQLPALRGEYLSWIAGVANRVPLWDLKHDLDGTAIRAVADLPPRIASLANPGDQ